MMTLSSAVNGWRKSSRSVTEKHENCVEIGRFTGGAAVRDTKNRTAGHLTLTAGQWSTFLQALKTGRYDH